MDYLLLSYPVVEPSWNQLLASTCKSRCWTLFPNLFGSHPLVSSCWCATALGPVLWTALQWTVPDARLQTLQFLTDYVGNLMQMQDKIESWMRGSGALEMESKAPLGFLSIPHPGEAFY